MTAYDGKRVGAQLLLRGYTQAFSRLEEAMRQRGDAEIALYPLFETLEWAVALDEVIAEIWRPNGHREGLAWRSRVRGANAMHAVRYVRNRVHHQWADALRVEIVANRVLPFDGHSWLWRDADDLPQPHEKRPDKTGRDAYAAMVAAEPRVIYTLTYLRQAFIEVVGLLEPRHAASRAG